MSASPAYRADENQSYELHEKPSGYYTLIGNPQHNSKPETIAL